MVQRSEPVGRIGNAGDVAACFCFAQEILAENVPVISEDAEPAALPLRLSRPRNRAPIRDLRLLSPPRLRPLRIPL